MQHGWVAVNLQVSAGSLDRAPAGIQPVSAVSQLPLMSMKP